MEKKHSLWVCCCPMIRIGNIKYNIHIPESGVVPGQKIKITGECKDSTLWTKVKCSFSIIQVIQVIEFYLFNIG